MKVSKEWMKLSVLGMKSNEMNAPNEAEGGCGLACEGTV